MQTFIPIALSLVGIFLSAFMLFRKISHKKLACPREHPCDTVLHSKFAKTFGLPNELLGIVYFGFMLALIFLPLLGLAPSVVLYAMFFLMILGGLFSLYLLGLQAFVIKSWCAWCLAIAFTNILLIISLISIPTEIFAPILAKQKVFWVILHNLGFILGVGSATITDIFFFRFLKDKVISLEEKQTMDTLTNVIWIALAILVVTGFALFVPEQARLLASAKFLLKVFVVGVIIINGILLNMFVAPYMRRLSFEGTVPARRFRRLAFALGGVSLTSWYLAFLLGSLRKINLDFQTSLWAYLTLLVFVIIGSQIFERVVTKKFNSETESSVL